MENENNLSQDKPKKNILPTPEDVLEDERDTEGELPIEKSLMPESPLKTTTSDSGNADLILDEADEHLPDTFDVDSIKQDEQF